MVASKGIRVVASIGMRVVASIGMRVVFSKGMRVVVGGGMRVVVSGGTRAVVDGRACAGGARMASAMARGGLARRVAEEGGGKSFCALRCERMTTFSPNLWKTRLSRCIMRTPSMRSVWRSSTRKHEGITRMRAVSELIP